MKYYPLLLWVAGFVTSNPTCCLNDSSCFDGYCNTGTFGSIATVCSVLNLGSCNPFYQNVGDQCDRCNFCERGHCRPGLECQLTQQGSYQCISLSIVSPTKSPTLLPTPRPTPPSGSTKSPTPSFAKPPSFGAQPHNKSPTLMRDDECKDFNNCAPCARQKECAWKNNACVVDEDCTSSRCISAPRGCPGRTRFRPNRGVAAGSYASIPQQVAVSLAKDLAMARCRCSESPNPVICSGQLYRNLCEASCLGASSCSNIQTDFCMLCADENLPICVATLQFRNPCFARCQGFERVMDCSSQKIIDIVGAWSSATASAGAAINDTPMRPSMIDAAVPSTAAFSSASSLQTDFATSFLERAQMCNCPQVFDFVCARVFDQSFISACFAECAGFNSGQLIPGRCQATATIGGAFSTQARNDEQQGTLLPGRPALSNPVRPPVDFKYSSAHGPALSNLGNEPFERPGECGMSRCGSLDPVQTLAAISPLCWCDVACVRRGDCCKDHTRSCALAAVVIPEISEESIGPKVLSCEGRCGKVGIESSTFQSSALPVGGLYLPRCSCDHLCYLQNDCCDDILVSCPEYANTFSMLEVRSKQQRGSGLSEESSAVPRFVSTYENTDEASISPKSWTDVDQIHHQPHQAESAETPSTELPLADRFP